MNVLLLVGLLLALPAALGWAAAVRREREPAADPTDALDREYDRMYPDWRQRPALVADLLDAEPAVRSFQIEVPGGFDTVLGGAWTAQEIDEWKRRDLAWAERQRAMLAPANRRQEALQDAEKAAKLLHTTRPKEDT